MLGRKLPSYGERYLFLSGPFPDEAVLVIHEAATPRYRATSAPHEPNSLTASQDSTRRISTISMDRCAQRMIRGSIESPSDMATTVLGIALYDELHLLSLRLARYLEQRGHRAAIVPPYSPVEMSEETKCFTGDVSLCHAAVTAGLWDI